MRGLTEKQQEMLDFIDHFSRSEGMAPTVYEIADHFKIKSATAFAHLRALQRKGYVTRSSKARSLTLLRSDSPRHLSLTLSIPLLGRISAGVPLLEIVTEPDIRSPEEARAYLVKLQQILRYLGVSSGDMEKGAMRCEANVSVRPVGQAAFGTKVEVKNLNSFRSVKLALEYEVARQIATLEAGDDGLGRRARPHRGPAEQGIGERLPLFPGAGPAAPRSQPGMGG